MKIERLAIKWRSDWFTWWLWWDWHYFHFKKQASSSDNCGIFRTRWRIKLLFLLSVINSTIKRNRTCPFQYLFHSSVNAKLQNHVTCSSTVAWFFSVGFLSTHLYNLNVNGCELFWCWLGVWSLWRKRELIEMGLFVCYGFLDFCSEMEFYWNLS